MRVGHADVQDILLEASEPLCVGEIRRRLTFIGVQASSLEVCKIVDRMLARKRRGMLKLGRTKIKAQTSDGKLKEQWGYAIHINKPIHSIDENLLTKLHYRENGQLPAEHSQAHTA